MMHHADPIKYQTERIEHLESTLKDLYKSNDRQGFWILGLIVAFVVLLFVIGLDNSKQKQCESILSTVKTNILTSREFLNGSRSDFESFMENGERADNIDCYPNE